jgi:7-cyano-7-deazaguanine synthase
MCGLYGLLVRDPSGRRLDDVLETWERCQERGRDSWGVMHLTGGWMNNFGDPRPPLMWCSNDYVGTGDTNGHPAGIFGQLVAGAWLGSRRGEPTTEWVREKTHADTQPFVSPSGDWWFVHNGTIANDKSIHPEVRRPTVVDSYAIGIALDEYGFEQTIQRVLAGSFAILAVRTNERDVIHYATNYKPLFLRGSLDGAYVQVASQASHLSHSHDALREPGVKELPPYTWGRISTTGMWSESLVPKMAEKQTLVVCSGGLDSATAAWYHKERGDHTVLLHFLYGAKAEGPEERSVRALSERLGTVPSFVRTEAFVSGHSPLTDPNSAISDETGEGMGGAELAHEWVPARNTVFAALALALAESWRGFTTVAFGTNLEEASAFPDNEPEWANKIRALIPYAVKPYQLIEFSTPVGNLMKKEIVQLGRELGVPFELTWSCYRGEDVHCGKCGPCFNRKIAFEMAGSKDPVFARE